MLIILKNHHKIVKSNLYKIHLLPKKSQYTGDILWILVEEEVNKPSYLGYSSMWNLMQSKYNILVSIDIVMTVLNAMNPDAKKQRKYFKIK